ncbi:MAG: (2Fe-2S) ferredoxin domain-containing protein [Planctomycetes bacterium]|nr:(2Fe-2S) ferredoxin domain-containing protein [Planctomycetota bacterium]
MSERLVYVCDGGDCSEKGSVELCEKLKEQIAPLDPEGTKVKVRKYPCFGGCEHGINITVWPDKVFYSRVQESDLPAIVEHVAKDAPPVQRLTGVVKPDVEGLIWQLLDSPY